MILTEEMQDSHTARTRPAFIRSKRIIKRKGHELYLTADGAWTSEIENAEQFKTLQEVLERISSRCLRDVEMVSLFQTVAVQASGV